jgi:hypothetical protein
MNRDLNSEFKDLVKNEISPRLKTVGYKKKNLNYNRQLHLLSQCIKIQKSQWNHHDRISFTINYGCFNELVYRLSRNRTESASFMSDDDCFIWGRTGHLIYGTDYWYELLGDSDYDKLCKQIAGDLDNNLLPLMQKLESFEFILKLIRTDVTQRPKGLVIDIDDIAIFELEFGDYERGKRILLENYERALIPKSVSSKTVYPGGREEVRWSEPNVNQYHIDKLERIGAHYRITLADEKG